MIIGIPLMQLFLFGFAINFNPKSLPTAVSIADPGVYARSIVAAMPPVLMFFLMQKHFIAGLTLGAVK